MPYRENFFFILGAQKSGTTWLADAVRRHPSVFIPPQKELYYFTRNFHKGEIWYEQQFSKRGCQSIIGEATPNYLAVNYPDYNEIPQRIKALIPTARFIVVLRNPVDRAISAYMHHVVRGRFDPQNNINEHFSELLNSSVSNSGILEFGLYYQQLSKYFELFDRKQFLIIKYEDDLCQNADTLLSTVLHFLGADTESFRLLPGHRRNEGIKSDFFARAGAKFSRFMKNDDVRLFYGGFIQHGCVFLERIFNFKPIMLDTTIRNELENYYKEDYGNLCKLLKLKSPVWGE